MHSKAVNASEKEIYAEFLALGNVSPHFEAFRSEAVAPDVAEAKLAPKAGLAENIERPRKTIQDYQFDPNFPGDILYPDENGASFLVLSLAVFDD
jgi:hypothetical protein